MRSAPWPLVLLGLLVGVARGLAVAATVPELLETYECTRCHRLTSPHRLVGPSLWRLGERADAATIRAAILEPDAVVAPGYPPGVMRACLQANGFYRDIQRQPALLERIVAFLAGASPAPLPLASPQPAAMHPVPAGEVRTATGQAVVVPAFAIDATPVTHAAFERFIAAGGYRSKAYWHPVGWKVVVRRRRRTHPHAWDPQAAPAQPVTGVTWYEADAYCRWRGAALPSTLQWQRACLAVRDWFGAAGKAGDHWEWTAEARWQGGASATSLAQRCAATVPAYPAVEHAQVGFRCAVPLPAAPR
ncbi:MAG: hypothetical protein KatS3mg131_2317 [Candidatus Tectimicrobiota bacterium]|nr:MAG: hypothetical protein KatS3mg131_2317 [Candidatus Tectomicrobia bacterium]